MIMLFFKENINKKGKKNTRKINIKIPNHIRQIKNKGTFINFTEYIIIFNSLFKSQKK